MPRIKRKPHRRRSEWTNLHRAQLLHGRDHLGDAFGLEDRGTFDADSAREAWGELGDELVVEHICGHPGTRPWAWWMFDAPEAMRRVGTMRFRAGIGPKNPRRFDRNSREFVAEADFPHDERLAYWRARYQTADAGALERFDDAFAVYETEREYLERLGLLTAAEKKGMQNV